jgi:hypothetical protein
MVSEDRFDIGSDDNLSPEDVLDEEDTEELPVIRPQDWHE